MIPGGFLSSQMVPGWFKSELSAAGTKWDIEITPWPSDDDDIYIMMQCLCICLSRKIITSHFRAECQRRKVSGLRPSNDDDDDDDPLVTQCYTVARTTMGDMTDWEKILWYCLYNCSPPYFFVVHCIEDWAKRRDTEVECFVGSRRTTGWGKQNPSRVPTFLKWSTIALSYSFWEKICLRESFLFWEAISSYSLILEYLLFERVLMFETNWHLFGQNEIVFTRKSVFGRKLC